MLERPFYVMERLPGEVPIPAPTLDGRGPVHRRRAPHRSARRSRRALAQLHAVDWRRLGLDFLGEPGAGRAAAARELARWEERISRSALPPDPAITAALLWLRAHVPSCDEITLVHGDYRLGNFLVESATATRRAAHRRARLGDGPPRRSAGGSRVVRSPLWRAGTDYASALLPPDEMAAAYAAAAGRAVDAARLRFYDVLTLVKMIAIMQTGIRAFNDARTDDLRMAIFDHQLPYLLVMLAMTLDFFGGGRVMRTTVERLIDGVVQTLTDAVLPDLATPFARGQLYAAVDVLRNLRDRVEPRADLADAESDSAVAALAADDAALAAAPLTRSPPRRRRSGIRRRWPPRQRRRRSRAIVALRAALVDALTAIAALPADDGPCRPRTHRRAPRRAGDARRRRPEAVDAERDLARMTPC